MKATARLFFVSACALVLWQAHAADNGVFVRFKLVKPDGAKFYVRLGGYIHNEPWYLPGAIVPAGADKKADSRTAAGEFTEWFDYKTHAGKKLHGRLNRAGGVAEFPNVTAKFITEPAAKHVAIEIELATAADAQKVVKHWAEEFAGDFTSFLVSPDLVADAKLLETANEMTERRLRWATEASGGQRHAPKELILQTTFWSPQRADLNAKEAKIVSLLGFNVVGNVPKELRAAFPEFKTPYASHDVLLGPQVTPEDVRASWEKWAKHNPGALQPGAPFNFQDEICCRPPIGKNEVALKHFHDWLKKERIPAILLGAPSLDEVVPIETPDVLRERMKENEKAARHVFYYTARFRQEAATESIIANSAEFHRQVGKGPLSSTLLADHPYFSGTGLGMGMEQQNTAWNGWPLAMDWFDVGRRRAVDVIGIEDWMGLQFMYGPDFTWEGFQLMGFQAAMFRSANREQPVIAWITPSDERNLRLKAASALCQGAKHFYYWCYGPTATSTENYWSDQQGSYPGMAHLSRLLEAGEPIIAPGKPRSTKVALLYSISSDLWQPFDYIHLLERRGLYLALVHDQYLLDMLTEEDVAAGRLKDYRVLYSADPCISTAATRAIADWVKDGGTLVGTCAAASRDEFGLTHEDWAPLSLFGIDPKMTVERQPGEYRVRGKLNTIPELDRIKTDAGELGCIGVKVKTRAVSAEIKGTFAKDGTPAIFERRTGKGRTVFIAATPGVSYIKDAKFVANELAEKWPAANRRALTRYAEEAGAAPLVQLVLTPKLKPGTYTQSQIQQIVNQAHPIVESGIYDAMTGSALVLANFTYQPIEALRVEMPVRQRIASVKSLEHGALKFELVPAVGAWKEEGYEWAVRFEVKLGIDDLMIFMP